MGLQRISPAGSVPNPDAYGLFLHVAKPIACPAKHRVELRVIGKLSVCHGFRVWELLSGHSKRQGCSSGGAAWKPVIEQSYFQIV